MMNDNDFSNDYEKWIDGVRSQIYEEMLMLGEEKYHMQMSERVQEAAKKYGFAIDRKKPTYPDPTRLEKETEAKRT